MQEIKELKVSFLQDTEIDFLQNFVKRNLDFQSSFLKELKSQNLDILFYQTIKTTNTEQGFTNKIIQLLKKEFVLEKGRDSFYRHRFDAIINKAEFPLVLLKGWHLQQTLGLDLYKRSCDVDILVKEENFTAALTLFQKEFGFFLKSRYYAYGQQCLLHKNGMCIDLHKKLIALQSFDSLLDLSGQKLFKEVIPQKSEAGIYYVFSKEMELVHLSTHFMLHHNGYGFILVYELKHFLDKYFSKMELSKLLEISKRYNSLIFLVYTLLIVQKLCNLSAETKKVIRLFVKKYDEDFKTFKSFEKEFSTSAFYNDEGISNRILKQLHTYNLSTNIAFFSADVNFRFYCFFRYLSETLRIG